MEYSVNKVAELKDKTAKMDIDNGKLSDENDQLR